MMMIIIGKNTNKVQYIYKIFIQKISFKSEK